MVELLLAAVAVLLAGGTLALAWMRSPRLATLWGAASAVAGCGLGLAPALGTLWHGTTSHFESHIQPLPTVYGDFVVRLDPLSAYFLAPILLVSALAAIYGSQYLMSFAGRKWLGVPWFFFNAMIASMMMVLVARNGLLFILAWETMSLASFFLVCFDDEQPAVRKAARTYLVATHLATALLLVFFILLGRQAGSLDFAHMARLAEASPELLNVLFGLALVGFGTKAGLMPFHVWSPEAYPVAPHHVTAVLSAGMSKVGVYGLVRTLSILGHAPQSWAWALIALGAVSSVLGIVSAVAQRDLKRLLAYSSIENVGVIALGLGTGLLGVQAGVPALAVLGFSGALLHVANHSLFKGLLFLGAGAVECGTGTREIDRLGGLLKRMPVTALAFLVGSVAICGLPPLGGFMSEFLIYKAAFREEMYLGTVLAVPALAVIASLSLVGGLAAIGFSKAFALVFLGQPRTEQAASARRPGWLLGLSLLVLTGLCIAAAPAAAAITSGLQPAVRIVAGPHLSAFDADVAAAAARLRDIMRATSVFLAAALLLGVVRWRLLAGREVARSSTWGCGYVCPSSRMQYTGSSFVQPVTDLLARFLRTRRSTARCEGYFPHPDKAAFASETSDIFQDRLWRPAFQAVGWALARLRWMQHGLVHLYVLYIAITIVFLLVLSIGLRP